MNFASNKYINKLDDAIKKSGTVSFHIVPFKHPFLKVIFSVSYNQNLKNEKKNDFHILESRIQVS